MSSKKDLNVLVGANIKREREKVGYTQDQFSELLSMEPKSLSSVERGVVGVSLTTLLKICEILHISPNVLLLEQSQKNNTDSIVSQLERLSPEQFGIVSDVITDLLKAFSLNQ